MVTWDETDDRISALEYEQIHRSFQLRPGDLLLTIVGSLGRRAVFDGSKVTFQRSVAFVRPDLQRVSERFLFQWFGHSEFQQELVRRSNSTAQAGLYLGELAQTRVPVYPLPEQVAIADILDTLDAAIRQTEAIIEKLKLVKQGLLHDLLTRGIDDNGELRPPQSEAPHLYKQSALGWIPSAWCVRVIAEVGQAITGSTPPSSVPGVWGAGIPFVTPAEVIEGQPIESAERSVCDRGLAYVRLLPPGSTLVVCIGSTIGRVGTSGVEACTNQQINALVPGAIMASEFAHVAVRMHVGQLRAMAGLQAVPIVNKASFETMRIPVPPRAEQLEISERLRAATDRISQEESAAVKLGKAKAGLMDDLLTGRVRVTPLLAESVAR